jgi:hypothetical protein
MSFILQDLNQLATKLENINVMTYDFSGPWLQRPSANRANGYGNINCRFDTGKWNWWLCSGGYLTGPATAHHTILYPSVKGMNALACNDPSAPNTPGCWNGVREQSYSMYGGMVFESKVIRCMVDGRLPCGRRTHVSWTHMAKPSGRVRSNAVTVLRSSPWFNALTFRMEGLY